MSNPDGKKKIAKILVGNQDKSAEVKIEEQNLQSQRIIDYPGVTADVLAKNTIANNDCGALVTAIGVKNECEIAFHNAVANVGTKERKFDLSRTGLAEEIETTFNYDHNVYEAMGCKWYFAGPGTGISALGQVTNVKAKPLTEGSFKINFKGVDGDPIYEYFYTLGDPDKEDGYQYLGSSSKQSKTFINKVSTTKMWIKVRATKDDFEDGAWSNPVRIVVP